MGELPKARTLGNHIATRLVEIGCKDFFAVPGDFNMVLLDQLLEEPGLKMVSCCNELNAGYAADGYARVKRVACVAVTFTVGGLSVINAIAGAYSEDLAVICLVGAPNSNDFNSGRIIHHSIGLPDFGQELRCFQQVTCDQAVLTNLNTAHKDVDRAIASAVRESKPVYISVSCNLASMHHPTFTATPVPFALSPRRSNGRSLKSALEATVEMLKAAAKPVLLGGPLVRANRAEAPFLELADASKYPVAVMVGAKGMFPESHERFMGTYWGVASSPFVEELVESADVVLLAGCVITDCSSVGYSLLLRQERTIQVDPDRVTVGGQSAFGCVLMVEFLGELAAILEPNDTAWRNFERIFVPAGSPPPLPPGAPLRANILFQHIEKILTGDSAVLAETGDSWFNCQHMKLPDNCRFEAQMLYASIGWSVGAALGFSVAAKDKRAIVSVGDGSFQMTVQEVSTLIRYGLSPIIFLINNGGYTIEAEIHDGPYNAIKNWNYTGVVESFANGEGKLFTAKVRTEEELVTAIAATQAKPDHLCFIEVLLHKDDASRQLLEWGSRLANANSRPPHVH